MTIREIRRHLRRQLTLIRVKNNMKRIEETIRAMLAEREARS